MERMLTVPDEINNIIREAFGKDLVRSDVIVWRYFRDQRNITGQMYGEEKAQKIFETTPDFLKEAQCVLSRLHGENRSLDQPD